MFEILSSPVDGQKISTAPDRCHRVLTMTTVVSVAMRVQRAKHVGTECVPRQRVTLTASLNVSATTTIRPVAFVVANPRAVVFALMRPSSSAMRRIRASQERSHV